MKIDGFFIYKRFIECFILVVLLNVIGCINIGNVINDVYKTYVIIMSVIATLVIIQYTYLLNNNKYLKSNHGQEFLSSKIYELSVIKTIKIVFYTAIEIYILYMLDQPSLLVIYFFINVLSYIIFIEVNKARKEYQKIKKELNESRSI